MPKSIDTSVNNSFVQINCYVNANSNAKFNAAHFVGLIVDAVNDIRRIKATNFKLTREIRFGYVGEFAPECVR